MAEPIPAYIERISAHLRAKGMNEHKALATAIQTARKFCASGDTNWPGRQSINLGSRAEACAAVSALERAGIATRPPITELEPVSEEPWDGSPSRFTDLEYARSCLIDRGPSFTSAHERYAVPIREPDGRLSREAVHAAPGLLEQLAGIVLALIRQAARRLLAAFRALGDEPPESLRRLAGRDERRSMETTAERPTPGVVEQRSVPLDAPPLRVEGNRLCGLIPFGVESRDLGGWRERLEPGCLAQAVKDDLVATLGHDVNRILGRFPTTLTTEDRDDGMFWEVDLPNGPTGQDVKEAVRRGDLRSTSWRMIVGRDRWEGDLRVVEEIRELRDVAVVTNAAYETTAELRERPEHDTQAPAEEREEEQDIMETEARTTQGGGGLTVEDRSATVETPDVESRIHEMIRGTAKGESRSLTLASGDAITPPQIASYLWDRLRPRSVALSSGVRVIPTDRKTIQWPKVVSDPVPEWVAETDVITTSDPVFTTLEADPKKLAARTEFSNEVLDDSEPEAEGVVRRLMERALALKLDAGFFAGNPSSDPESIRGLKFVSGIQSQSMGTNGAAITDLDVITDALGLLEDADVPGPFVIVMRPSNWRALRKLTDTQGRRLLGDFSRETPPNIDGSRVYTTTQLAANETQGTSSDASSIYVYSTDPDTGPALVRRKDVEILLDRSRLFDKDMSEMRGKTRVDLLVPEPLAVVRITGVRLV